MALWGNKDQANNSPAFATTSVNLAPTAANANTLFNNVTLGDFDNNGVAMNVAVGQFGVDVSEAANTTTEGTKVAHAGWNLRTAGAGPLTGVVVAAAGAGYANSDTYVIAGSTNATGNLVTNATGNVVSFTTTSGGGVFTSATPTVTITTAAGVGASLTATAGGRAGRVSYETLVAMGSITGDSDGSLL